MTDFEMFKTVLKKVDPENEWQEYYEVDNRAAMRESWSEETMADYPNWDKEISVCWDKDNNPMIFIFDKEGQLIEVNP